MKNAKERMIQAEKDYLAVKKDNEKLNEVLSFLTELKDRLDPLQEYYFTDWLNDMVDLEKEDFTNQVMNEDSIYEEMAEQYEVVKEILLVCAQYINR